MSDQACVHDWELQEGGYIRSWSTILDEAAKTVTAVFNGAEDWSEDGDGEMRLVCLMCSETKPLPDGFEVVYE